MNPLEERLNRLETRVTRYRNFNVLLCLLLVTVVTVAAKDGVSPFQAKSAPQPAAMPHGDYGVPDLPDRDVPEVSFPDDNFAGKFPAQTQGTIRTTRLEIVNGDGQTVVLLSPSTSGGGLVFVNSAENKNLVYIGSSAARGDGLVLIDSKEEKNLISLGSDSNSGGGEIWVRNRDEEHLVSLFADDMSGHLSLQNNNDKTIAYLGTYSDYLGTHSDGNGVLEIFSKNGTELITAGSNTTDNGLIRVSNRNGAPGVALVAGNERGYVGIQNAQERLLAELTATPTGEGLVRTWSPLGITTWASNSVKVNTGISLRGDLDNDGDVDGDDFLLFSENFGKKK